MNNRFAIIENGVVVNVTVGVPSVLENQMVIECPIAGPGWIYQNGEFVEPATPTVVESISSPSKDELLAQLRLLESQIQQMQ